MITQEKLDQVLESETDSDIVALRDTLAQHILVALVPELISPRARPPRAIVEQAYSIAEEALISRKTVQFEL